MGVYPPKVIIAVAALDYTAFDLIAFSCNGVLLKLRMLAYFAWVATLSYFRWYYREWATQKPPHVELLLEEDEWEAISDKPLMYSTLIILGLTVVAFSAKSLLDLPIEIDGIALSGAAFALIVARPKNE